MNSTPKQQDGDDGGVAPASGARSSLEQTVLGVAPAPILPVAQSTPSEVAPQRALPAPPPPIEPPVLSSPVPPPAAAPSIEPTGPVVISAPVIVVSAPSPPAAPAWNVPQAEPPPSEAAETAPIPLLVRSAQLIEVTAPPRPTPREPAPARVATADVTLPVGAVVQQPPVQAPEGVAPGSFAPVERTASSDEYLREARQAALDAVARSAPPSAPAATGPANTEDAASLGDADAAPANQGGTRPSIMSTPLPRDDDAPISSENAPVRTTRGFEPVPVVRAPLSESLSGGLGPVAELSGLRNGGPPSSARSRPGPPAPRGGDVVLRWLLLAAVALISIATVMVGQRVWHRYQDGGSRPTGSAAAPSAAVAEASGGEGSSNEASGSEASTSRALMPSRALAEPPPPGRAVVVSVTGGHPGDSPSPGSAGPESQLAATAGRLVMASNYAEALPLYQQLERAYPENTAYVAMSRLLEKKVGASNDTRTVAPAPSKPVKK